MALNSRTRNMNSEATAGSMRAVVHSVSCLVVLLGLIGVFLVELNLAPSVFLCWLDRCAAPFDSCTCAC